MKKIQTILCGSLAVLALAACTSEDNVGGGEEPTLGDVTYTMTVEAAKADDNAAEARATDGARTRATDGSDGRSATGNDVADGWDGETADETQATDDATPTTRALSEGEGYAINFEFKTTDYVYVHGRNAAGLSGSLRPERDGASTTLKGMLSANWGVGTELRLVYPRTYYGVLDYKGQDGTLTGSETSIDRRYDYAETYVTVTGYKEEVQDSRYSISTTPATGENAFKSQQSITRFTFTDGASPVSVKTLTISAPGLVQSVAANGTETTGDIDVTLDEASPTVWVALRNNSNAKQTYSFTATDAGGRLYRGTKKANLANGSNYTATVTLTPHPAGAMLGEFTVNDYGKKINFSKGNLQARLDDDNTATGATWQFAEHQYDCIGNKPGNTTLAAGSTIDLFGAWNRSGQSSAAWGVSTSTDKSDYYTEDEDFFDWGANPALQATLGTGWRTLPYSEFEYMLNTRAASTVGGTADARYCKATVADVNGLVIFPDAYTHPSGLVAPANVNKRDGHFDANTWNATEWAKMEASGAVFLPAAGKREGTGVTLAGERGIYWNGSIGLDYYSVYLYEFYNSNDGWGYDVNRYKGYSVRLVRDVDAPMDFPRPPLPMSEATASDVGRVIGSDGIIYDNAAQATAAGTTATAMIAYVGSQNAADGLSAYSSTYNHGLAVALTDVKKDGSKGSELILWEDAVPAAVSYVGTRPASTTGWFLPSLYQWQRIFIGCGSGYQFTSPWPETEEIYWGMSTYNFSSANFRRMLTDCGGNDVIGNAYVSNKNDTYWTNTKNNTTGYNYGYTFSGANVFENTESSDKKRYVRPVFAF